LSAPHLAVQAVAIAGFADERWGKAPHPFVVLKQDARADERELRELALANLVRRPISRLGFSPSEMLTEFG